MTRPLLVALVVWLAASAPALAHKIRLFAAAEGAVVSGYGYFNGGDRAQDVSVTVEADGKVVFSGRTADDGTFRFAAVARADHVIKLDSGDGHAASFTLRAAELPESLPRSGPSTDDAIPARPAAAAETPPPPMPSTPDGAQLTEMVERAVARQIRPLREQLDAYEQTTRWRDAVGGIGFIVGLAGLAYGMAARKPGGKRA